MRSTISGRVRRSPLRVRIGALLGFGVQDGPGYLPPAPARGRPARPSVDQRARLRRPLHQQGGDRQDDLASELALDAPAAIARIEADAETWSMTSSCTSTIRFCPAIPSRVRMACRSGARSRGLLRRERMEQDDVLKAVEELRPENAPRSRCSALPGA